MEALRHLVAGVTRVATRSASNSSTGCTTSNIAAKGTGTGRSLRAGGSSSSRTPAVGAARKKRRQCFRGHPKAAPRPSLHIHYRRFVLESQKDLGVVSQFENVGVPSETFQMAETGVCY